MLPLISLSTGFSVTALAKASSGPRLLALDGDGDGGVRGLSVLMILERLVETINPDIPPKPCDCFDMIGGTGTGG
jgi:patatin-like phospholipase/acyl hydrolase